MPTFTGSYVCLRVYLAATLLALVAGRLIKLNSIDTRGRVLFQTDTTLTGSLEVNIGSCNGNQPSGVFSIAALVESAPPEYDGSNGDKKGAIDPSSDENEDSYEEQPYYSYEDNYGTELEDGVVVNAAEAMRRRRRRSPSPSPSPTPPPVQLEDIEYYLNVVAENGAYVQKRLYFPADNQPLPNVATGAMLSINGRPALYSYNFSLPCLPVGVVPPEDRSPDASITTAAAILVDSWQVIPAAAAAPGSSSSAANDSIGAMGGDGNYDITSITYILNMCGSPFKVSATVQSVKAAWFGDDRDNKPNFGDYLRGPFNGPWLQQANLQDYWSSCSFNRFSFTPDNNLVVGPIDVPCSGMLNDGTGRWTTRSCSYVNSMGWIQYAQNFVRENLGIDPTKYRHHIAILPTAAGCGLGLANIGCTQDCKVWLGLDPVSPAPMVSAVFHELGHNYFLNHAGDDAEPNYGDETCAMGMSGMNRCYNHPHAWQMGWASPVAGGDLDVGDLPLNKWSRVISLPSLLTSPNNFVRVTTSSWAPGAAPTYYIGYRTRQGYDLGFTNRIARKVYVYQYDGTCTTDAMTTRLKATLTPRGVYDDDSVNLRIWTLSTGLSSANVRVCRYSTDADNCT